MSRVPDQDRPPLGVRAGVGGISERRDITGFCRFDGGVARKPTSSISIGGDGVERLRVYFCFVSFRELDLADYILLRIGLLWLLLIIPLCHFMLPVRSCKCNSAVGQCS